MLRTHTFLPEFSTGPQNNWTISAHRSRARWPTVSRKPWLSRAVVRFCQAGRTFMTWPGRKRPACTNHQSIRVIRMLFLTHRYQGTLVLYKLYFSFSFTITRSPAWLGVRATLYFVGWVSLGRELSFQPLCAYAKSAVADFHYHLGWCHPCPFCLYDVLGRDRGKWKKIWNTAHVP